MHRKTRFQIGEYWLSQKAGRTSYYATKYNPKTRQTERSSLRTSDFEKAKERLAEFIVVHANLKEESPRDILISTLFARYYDGHAKSLPSADVTLRALNTWLEFYDSSTVSDLSVAKQEQFISHLRLKGHSDAYIKRIITAGKAALNYAYKRQEISHVPHIFNVTEGEPEEYVISIKETAALFNAVEPGSKEFLYLMLAYNTLARPAAILDLTPQQVNLNDRLINLLPPGRRQNKKRRPTLPITDTLLPWLQECGTDTFVHHHGRRIANNKKSFNSVVADAGLMGKKITRKAIRHTMATEMRRRQVNTWEVEGWLGHRLPSTSERYAKYSPDYLGDGATAIDNYFEEVQKKVGYSLRAFCVPAACPNTKK